MPSRIIRETILTSKAVNSLPEQAELFYRRLMSVVDDFGRLECDLEILRAKCFPRRYQDWPEERINDCLMSVMCAQMSDGCPLVTVYEIENRKYLQLNNFGQRVRVNVSKCPAPDGQMSVICTPHARGRTPDSEAYAYAYSETEAGEDERCSTGTVAAEPAGPPSDPVQEIAEALQRATDAKVNLAVAEQLCRAAALEAIHPWLVRRWIDHKGTERKARGHPIREPKLFLQDWSKELPAWIKSNLSALNGGHYALMESPACGRCKVQQFRFEDGTIVRCKCTGKRALGLVKG